jgi:hypothetical protein
MPHRSSEKAKFLGSRKAVSAFNMFSGKHLSGWKKLTPEEKDTYNKKAQKVRAASGKQVSGYNMFFRDLQGKWSELSARERDKFQAKADKTNETYFDRKQKFEKRPRKPMPAGMLYGQHILREVANKWGDMTDSQKEKSGGYKKFFLKESKKRPAWDKLSEADQATYREMARKAVAKDGQKYQTWRDSLKQQD